MLRFLDYFFVVFHTLLILFNLLGWIFKLTRRINLLTLLLTGASWIILGLFYGIGYCPLTDWHFQILNKLGNNNLPYSYIKYLYDRLTNGDINAKTVDSLTVILYSAALVASVFFNIKDYLKKKQLTK